MKEYTHTKMKKVLTTIDSSRFIPAVWQREFIYADTASVPRNIKLACALLVKIILMIITIPDTLFDQEDGEVIAKGLSTEPDNFLPQRLNLYNAFETKDYDNGIQQTSGFFNTPNGKFIWQDYLYQDRLLNATQQYEPSLENLSKAVKLAEYYRYLGYFYYLKKDLDNSKIYWNKVLEIDPSNKVAQEALQSIQ